MYAILSKRCFKPFFRGGIRSVRRIKLKTDGMSENIGRIARAVGVNVIDIHNEGSLRRLDKNRLRIGDVLDKARRL